MAPDLQKLSFGINYVPSRKWWYCWNDFTPDDIARDLDTIASLDMDHIRIMLLWPFFQPNRTWVSERHLDHLDVLMSIARERNLNVCPSLLTGWLSGWSFRPNYERPADFYSAPEMREPVELYFRRCAERLNQHPNFIGFDFGNEMNCCWEAKSTADGDSWMTWLLDLCELLSPGLHHGNGVDHKPWFFPHTFSPETLARRQPLVPIHSWIGFTGATDRGAVLDRVCTRLAPAMAALVRARAGDPTKPVWLQEFGAPSFWMGKEVIPRFMEQAVHAAVAGGICRLTWWGSHDIRREFQFDEIEYDVGLIDIQNRPKPEAFFLKGLAREFSGRPVCAPPAVEFSAFGEHTFENTWEWIEAVQAQLP